MKAQITAPQPVAGHEVTEDYITRTLVYPEAELEQGKSGKGKDKRFLHIVYYWLNTLKNGFHEFFDTRFIVGVSSFDLTLRDNAANGHGAVTHMQCQAGDT